MTLPIDRSVSTFAVDLSAPRTPDSGSLLRVTLDRHPWKKPASPDNPSETAMAEIRDEEDGSIRPVGCCAPLAAMCRPVEVEDLFDSGY